MRAPRPYVPESVDPTEVSPSGPYRAYKTAGLLLLAAAWVVLGLVGHGPWKFDDATSFGVAFEMAQRGDPIRISTGSQRNARPENSRLASAANVRMPASSKPAVRRAAL